MTTKYVANFIDDVLETQVITFKSLLPEQANNSNHFTCVTSVAFSVKTMNKCLMDYCSTQHGSRFYHLSLKLVLLWIQHLGGILWLGGRVLIRVY